MKNQQYDNYQIALIGVNLASQILEIDPPRTSFIAQSVLPNPTITSMYLQESKDIVFNEDWVSQANLLEVISTSFHECRHAYQHHYVSTSSREDKDTRDKWAAELSSYFQPNTNKPQEVDVDYLQQSIEIDAMLFTHREMKRLFAVDTQLPKNVLFLLKGEYSY